MTESTPYMTAKEAAAYLRISLTTLYKYARDNRIRHVRMPGGSLRFLRADLADFKPTPQDEEDAEAPATPSYSNFEDLRESLVGAVTALESLLELAKPHLPDANVPEVWAAEDAIREARAIT